MLLTYYDTNIYNTYILYIYWLLIVNYNEKKTKYKTLTGFYSLLTEYTNQRTVLNSKYDFFFMCIFDV